MVVMVRPRACFERARAKVAQVTCLWSPETWQLLPTTVPILLTCHMPPHSHWSQSCWVHLPMMQDLHLAVLQQSPLPPTITPPLLRREWVEVVGKEGKVDWDIFYQAIRRHVVGRNGQAMWDGVLEQVKRRLAGGAPGAGGGASAPLQLASELEGLDADALFMVVAGNAVLQAPVWPAPYEFELPLGRKEAAQRTVKATGNFSRFITW